MTAARATSRFQEGAPRAVVALVLLVLMSACGVRTDPLPPEDTAARAPDDFEAVRGKRGVELTWERSTKTVDGGRLYDLESFVVERRVGGSGPFETVATIPVTDTDKLRTQRTFQFVDENAPARDDLQYQVRAMTADGEPGVASTTMLSVPLPGATTDQEPAPREENR